MVLCIESLCPNVINCRFDPQSLVKIFIKSLKNVCLNEYGIRRRQSVYRRLQHADDEEDEADGRTVSEKLIDIMQHDPNASVI
jgi:hypothetical protein